MTQSDYGDGMIVYAKYDPTPIHGDGKTVLESEDDAASVNLGNGWRTPTFNEFKELRENCTWAWTTRNGVNGMLVTGPCVPSRTNPRHLKLQPAVHSAGCFLLE